MDAIDDLVAEQDRIDDILGRLAPDEWDAESGAPGWTMADVVLHLAQSEEMVAATIASNGGDPWPRDNAGIDDAAELMVRAERADGATVLERWRRARTASARSLRTADPQRSYAWAAAPLKPRTLATTRLAEHWTHGLDITGPLGIPYPDTERLHHVAWLGHRSLAYAFSLEGEEPHDVFCELTAPDGVATWRFGPPAAESTIRGAAGAFCRVGARRLAARDSGLTVSGPHAEPALRVLRNYAR
jgi:uncharacterized protein (TIGR03084 family)